MGCPMRLGYTRLPAPARPRRQPLVPQLALEHVLLPRGGVVRVQRVAVAMLQGWGSRAAGGGGRGGKSNVKLGALGET